jgi:hypothetical protein
MALVFRSARYAISTCFRIFRSRMEGAGQRSGGMAIVARHAPLIQSPAKEVKSMSTAQRGRPGNFIHAKRSQRHWLCRRTGEDLYGPLVHAKQRDKFSSASLRCCNRSRVRRHAGKPAFRPSGARSGSCRGRPRLDDF